jgi:hypothetical protein
VLFGAACSGIISPAAPTRTADAPASVDADALAARSIVTSLRVDEGSSGGGQQCPDCPPDVWALPVTAWIRASGNYFTGVVNKVGTFNPLSLSATGNLTVLNIVVGNSNVFQPLGRFDGAYLQLSISGDQANVSLNLYGDGRKEPLQVSGPATITSHTDSGCQPDHSRTHHVEVELTMPTLGATEIHLSQMVGCTP